MTCCPTVASQIRLSPALLRPPRGPPQLKARQALLRRARGASGVRETPRMWGILGGLRPVTSASRCNMGRRRCPHMDGVVAAGWARGGAG